MQRVGRTFMNGAREGTHVAVYSVAMTPRRQAPAGRDDLAEMLANLGVSEELIKSVEVVTGEAAQQDAEARALENRSREAGAFDLAEWTEDPPEPPEPVVPGASHADDWLKVLESLRLDIERLRAEQVQKTATARATEDN